MSIDESIRSFRDPWEGDTKIVMGIDIGPTYSGVAFTFLQKGVDQVIHRVTHWPGQETHNQQSKIPTLVWYDTNAKAMAYGAEALSCAVEEEAEDNGWFLARHFKLHLHPIDMRAKHELKLDSLPPGVNLRQIYSDFLGYLLEHTKAYFESRIVDGKIIWERYSSEMEVVIAHPNGWSLQEQSFLRSAAIAAGLATVDTAPSKVRFVTEAEASVHFCIHHTNIGNVLQPGMNFAVCDAGGSTVDTVLYSVKSARPVLKLEEKRASTCVQAGAIFIDFEAEKFLRRTLEAAGVSPEDIADYTKAGIKDFESTVKRLFTDETRNLHVTVGNTRFNNAAIGVRRGRMTLSGSTVKGFFDVCVREIISSVDQQIDGHHVPFILLVGGLGDSPYLRREFLKRYEPRGCQVTCTNDSTSKAVADGAVLWAAQYVFVSRAPLFSWGIETSVVFDPNDPDHIQRKETLATSSWTTIPGKWKSLVKKGIPLHGEHAVVTTSFSLEFPPSSVDLGKFELDLYNYLGNDEPVWTRNKQGRLLQKFRKAATIQADLNNLHGALEQHITSDGLQWLLDFDICIIFGGEELSTHLEWTERGCKRTSPCAYIPSSE